MKWEVDEDKKNWHWRGSDLCVKTIIMKRWKAGAKNKRDCWPFHRCRLLSGLRNKFQLDSLYDVFTELPLRGWKRHRMKKYLLDFIELRGFAKMTELVWTEYEMNELESLHQMVKYRRVFFLGTRFSNSSMYEWLTTTYVRDDECFDAPPLASPFFTSIFFTDRHSFQW